VRIADALWEKKVPAKVNAEIRKRIEADTAKPSSCAALIRGVVKRVLLLGKSFERDFIAKAENPRISM
jgi:hypothetical protein